MCCNKGGARKGESIHISESDCKSIVGKRLSLVKEASEYMRKAKGITEMMPQHNGTRGDMECDIVDYVLEKFPKEKRETR